MGTTAGFTAITGETGAGKSVILGALALLLGERADKSLIRTGADTCSVEAVFENASDPSPWRPCSRSMAPNPVRRPACW